MTNKQPNKTWSHPAGASEEDLLAACTTHRTKSGGPGGQHRNKVETKVVLTHIPTGIAAHAGERRSMIDNKRVALRRLRHRLAIEHRQPVPAGDITTEELSRHKTAKRDAQGNRVGRIACNPDNRDYPILLALVLDLLADSDWDTKQAAERLGVSSSQIIRLVSHHAPALVMLNKHRAEKNLRPLRPR